MKDFWKDIWDYMSNSRSDASNLTPDMWEMATAIAAQSSSEENIYEYLCMVCRNLAEQINMRLPENLHSRIVLGSQNNYTKEYLNKWGV